MTRFLERAHDLALSIAPELRAQPLYVVGAELAERVGTWDHRCHGLAIYGGVMPPRLRDALGPAYQGAGPVIALNLDRISEAAKPGCFVVCCQAIFIHELAHILPSEPVDEPPDDLALAADCSAQFVATMARLTRRLDNAGIGAVDHDLRWARRVCHLHARAASAGWSCHLHDSFRGPLPYARSSLYRDILGPEIEALRDRPFAEIEATEWPGELTTAWEEDIAFLDTLGGPGYGQNRRAGD